MGLGPTEDRRFGHGPVGDLTMGLGPTEDQRLGLGPWGGAPTYPDWSGIRVCRSSCVLVMDPVLGGLDARPPRGSR
ncbi:hypothetical protein CRG98_016461 [Punica granatum]|uniref:Uncharacterized protein n=1 Tax=Punica granatum TaxID=22663 RepID=A0A2I0K3K4_PUNGR|nr:hypothetical protein CRG98_016461 [Punica granatum]